MMKFCLRGNLGKQLVADVRNGNYAHAGEEVAIDKVLQGISIPPHSFILDVGCGRGGTAKYIHDKGLGTVIGFDIDEEAIRYAQDTYKEIRFYHSDVLNAADLFPEQKFDVICMFNSFYAFSDQLEALKQLRKISTDSAKLLLFDYADFSHGTHNIENITAISQDTIFEMLAESGWDSSLTVFENITTEYYTWYTEMLQRLHSRKTDLIERYGNEAYQYAINRFSSFTTAIDQGIWGGAIIRSSTIPIPPIQQSAPNPP